MMNVSTLINRLKSSQLFKDSFWALAGSTIGKGLSLIAGIAVARFLGSEIYGEYGTIKNTLVYIAIVSTFGFGYSATKFVTEYINSRKYQVHDLVKKIQSITLLFSCILAIILIIFAKEIAIVINAPHLSSTLRWSSILVILNAYTTTQTSILSGFKSFKKLSKINAVTGVTTLITSVIFTLMWELNGAILSLTIAYIVQIYISYKEIRRQLNVYKALDRCPHKEIKRMLRFSIPIALQESLYTIIHWATLYLLIKYSNYSEVGLSSAASLWSSVVIFIPAALKNVMFSHLSSSNNHHSLVNKLLLINLLSAAIPSIILICLSGFIAYLYGDTFIALPKILNVCLISSIFISVSEVYCYEFISIGKPWIVFIARLIRDSSIVLFCYIILQQISKDQAFYMSCISLCCHVVFYILLAIAYQIYYKDATCTK